MPSQQMVLEHLDTHTERKESEPHLTPNAKITVDHGPKWKRIKLCELGFLDIQNEKQHKAKEEEIGNLNFIKVKNLCIKGHHQEREKTTHRTGHFLQIMCLTRDESKISF